MKIYIFGPSACGKTTIGKKLSKDLNIKFFELDKVFRDFKENKSIINIKQRNELIDKLLKSNKSRILEGLYRQDWLDKIILDADYIFIVNKNKFLIDIFVIYRTLKRILGLEKNERISSLKVLINFIKLNHSNKFKKIHLKEFNQRLFKLKKESIKIKNTKEIENHINNI